MSNEVKIQTLAALIYFDSIKPEKRKDAIVFEKLTEEEQVPFIEPVVKVLNALGKLDLVPLPKPDIKAERMKEEQELNLLTDEVDKFIKNLKTTKPGLFPSRELAAQVLKMVRRQN